MPYRKRHLPLLRHALPELRLRSQATPESGSLHASPLLGKARGKNQLAVASEKRQGSSALVKDLKHAYDRLVTSPLARP
jgi:hypothetical protein